MATRNLSDKREEKILMTQQVRSTNGGQEQATSNGKRRESMLIIRVAAKRSARKLFNRGAFSTARTVIVNSGSQVMDSGKSHCTNDVVLPETHVTKPDDGHDLTSMEIFRAAQAAGVFDFWDDPRENVYSLEDGEPI